MGEQAQTRLTDGALRNRDARNIRITSPYDERVRCLRLLRCYILILAAFARPRGRGVDEELVGHPEADLLAAVHVEVVSALVRLVLPQPHLLAFVTASGVKKQSTMGHHASANITFLQTTIKMADTIWPAAGGTPEE
ncbi:hypothetical protein DNTS_018324 [Danionella cerebrum]|uniref:Uncharacterized protein n=1 Tax=Danionella cerebrum TaxID=2873325 RepID=A0A553QET6_9TELE|nr:hypothetical protein DNTS_018324 [Danionella translucida]